MLCLDRERSLLRGVPGLGGQLKVLAAKPVPHAAAAGDEAHDVDEVARRRARAHLGCGEMGSTLMGPLQK